MAVTTVSGLHWKGEWKDEAVPAASLDRIIENAAEIPGLWSDQVRPGDWILVRTRNSCYSLSAQEDGRFLVAGGWFAARGREQDPVRVCGCTWGGSIIHTRIVAAAGMFLEFDNGVRTTRIADVRLIRGGSNRPH